MADAIHQEVVIEASPQRVFAALTEAAQFSGFTAGAPAEIDGRAGGAFSCFGGQIVGRNVELVPGKRVVQAWRSGGWSDGVYSIVRFELTPEGKATRVVFDQSGYPAGEDAHLAPGWHKMYWEPLRKYLG
jgi:uncharacterized protein YndB with AHSA1/START domain